MRVPTAVGVAHDTGQQPWVAKIQDVRYGFPLGNLNEAPPPPPHCREPITPAGCFEYDTSNTNTLTAPQRTRAPVSIGVCNRPAGVCSQPHDGNGRIAPPAKYNCPWFVCKTGVSHFANHSGPPKSGPFASLPCHVQKKTVGHCAPKVNPLHCNHAHAQFHTFSKDEEEANEEWVQVILHPMCYDYLFWYGFYLHVLVMLGTTFVNWC